MSNTTADVVICGAGIAGISTAYHLAVKHGVKDVVLVDDQPPLSVTSDKSTEAYRNWWPGPGNAMVSLMNRSIDLLEELAHESGNVFHLNRRGYLYVTADPKRIQNFRQAAKEATALGAGPIRVHTGQPGDPPYVPAPAEGFDGQPDGADLILDRQLIREQFPYLSGKVVAALHARRCGWFSGQQLGMYLLEHARERGVRLVQSKVESVDVFHNQVEAIHLRGEDGRVRLVTRHFVIAAGPFLTTVGRMLGVELPVYSEFHTKVAFSEHLGIVPRDAPLLIWADPQVLPWTEDERALLEESEETKWMLDDLPSGVHTRPEGPSGSSILLFVWAYHENPVEPVFPLRFDAYYPELVLRGLATMIPGLTAYIGRAPKPVIDGGYYTKTRENRPLIGPLPVRGTFVIGALSGYGLMASPASGELLAAHITGSPLPSYAPAFALERYQDPDYQRLLEHWGTTWQL